MENYSHESGNTNNLEQREKEIDSLVEDLGKRENMNPHDILSDLITFASFEGTEYANPDYFEEVAEMIGIASDELIRYALSKGKAGRSRG